MKVDEDVVQHIATLARLHISATESGMFAQQLTRILDYVDTLNELDTSSVEPFIHPLANENVFRSDKPIKSYPREDILANAPVQDNGYYQVPKVVN